ncbi:MAG: ArsR family transcriptional regulator [Spartobacteria bacterium]|nr:ArsR family transcriptional regulator [Spartobacteria bacterium]
MNELINIMKALAEPVRLRAWYALREGELCVCQLITVLGLAPSTVSKHLSILHQAGLVQSRQAGKWVYYRLPRTHEKGYVDNIQRELFNVLDEDVALNEFNKKVMQVRKGNMEELCRTITRKRR